MKRLAEIIGKKAYETFPDEFENVDEAINEMNESFREEEGKLVADAMIEWAEEKTGIKIELIPIPEEE